MPDRARAPRRVPRGRAHAVSILETDKIDDDPAAEIAQPGLPGDLIDSREIDREPGALARPGLPALSVDVDQNGGPGRLDMNRAAAGERDRAGQRPIEHRVELDRPLGLRSVVHQGVGKDRAEFRDDGRIVDENPAGRKRGG